MADHKEDALPLGGMHSGGPPDGIPEGATRLMENMVARPGRWEKRPPFIYEDNIYLRGLANWSDPVNLVDRLVAFLYTGGGPTLDIKVKSASAGVETYGSAITGIADASDGYVSDFANYRGILYYTVAEGVGAAALPLGLHSFSGTAAKQYPLGGETLASLTVTPFVDRLVLGNVRATIVNQLGATNAYDSTAWATVTTTRTNITNGATVTSRITPTATTLSQIYLKDQYTLAATTTDTTTIYRADIRNTSPTYAMPLTLEIFYSQIWVTLTAYAVGAIRVPTTAIGNGFRYRCTVAGTSAAGEPAWPTTVSSTVVDGTVTWICDGKDALGSFPTTIPTLSENSAFLPYFVRGVHPPNPASTKVGIRIKFGTPSTGTIELAAIDVSLKDGVTDGDFTKKCFGQQLTVGKFVYPFFNQQSSATAAIALDNDIYWTETSDPNSIFGSNYMRLSDLPGRVTAAAVVAGRYVAFKRRGMWVFQGGQDPRNPLIRETFFAEFGCVGPRALCVFENTLYFVGESEVYAWKPGGIPQPLGGDAMREEIMARATWVESTAGFVTGLLRTIGITVDEGNRDLLVGAQQTYFHCIDLDGAGWSRLKISPFGSDPSPFVNLPLWNPLTRHVYCDSSGALMRYDDSSATEAVYATNGSNSPIAAVTLRPLPSAEISLDGVWISHMTTGSQASSTLVAAVSHDGGSTFAKSNTVRLTTVAARTTGRERVPLRQRGPRLVVKLTHTGNAGGASLTLTGVDAITRLLRADERARSNPTQVSSNL